MNEEIPALGHGTGHSQQAFQQVLDPWDGSSVEPWLPHEVINNDLLVDNAPGVVRRIADIAADSDRHIAPRVDDVPHSHGIGTALGLSLHHQCRLTAAQPRFQ